MKIIKNAKISTGEDDLTREVNIFIDGGKISRIETEPDPGGRETRPPGSGEVMDAAGLLVIPGAIDSHVHFDTPGYEWRGDFAHGTQAAVAGGVTTIIDMPDTSAPPVTNLKNLKKKLEAISDQAYCDFALWGGVSANSMIEEDWQRNMDELWEAGVVGFKTYLISGMDTFKELSIVQLGQVMQHANKIDALIGLHAEEKDIIRTRETELRRLDKNSLFDYYFSRSDPVEKQGVAIGVNLAKQTRSRLHIVHVASGSAAKVIRQGKMMNVDLSAETCPHYLHFTYKDFEKYGSLIKTAPVIKTAEDRDALWEGLKDNAIDFVATDHAPCPMKEKNTQNAWTDYAGMPGVELMLPYLFSSGCMKKRLTLSRLIEITSTSQAKRFGLYPKKGVIKVGSDADLVIIDPKKRWRVKGKTLHTKAKWTPFENLDIDGQVTKTLLRGKVVYDCNKGIVGKAGYGKLVGRQ